MRITLITYIFQGQHMILDTNGSSCVKVNFGIGAASTTREWDIMVIFFSLN